MNEQTPHSKKPFKPKIGYIVIAAIAAWFIYNLSLGSLLTNGSQAPSWDLKRSDGHGGLLSLDELKGKVVVLDFWSPYCPPCVKELDVLEKIARRMKGQGVEVVGITGGEDMDELLAYAKSRRPGYPWVTDTTGIVSNSYLVQSLPTLYIINRQGEIAASHVGYWGEDHLLAAINETLKQ